MAYQGLIDSQLRIAFNLAKDLATLATFTLKTAGEFDFNAKAAADIADPPVIAKIIVIDGDKRKTEGKLVRRQFMVKSRDVPNLKGFDTVAFDGHVWQIGPIIKGTGFILVVEALRTGT